MPAQALVVVGIVVVLLAGTVTAVAARVGMLGCLGSPTRLTVAAAPDIAPALTQIARRLSSDRLGATGRCLDVAVQRADPYQVANQLALRGATVAADRLPDVWVPDSSVWLDEARASQPALIQLRSAGSVAHSPVVIAMAKQVAAKRGWPNAKLGWADLMQDLASETPRVRVGLADPHRSAASLIGLLALRNAASTAGGQSAVVSSMRALSGRVSPNDSGLLGRLPLDPGKLDTPGPGEIQAFPLSEQAVWRYNMTNPSIALSAWYPRDGTPEFDYPYVSLAPSASQGPRAKERNEAVRDFLAAIQSRFGRNALKARAFRTAGDDAGPQVSPVNGLLGDNPPRAFLPTTDTVKLTLLSWSVVNMNLRLLAVLDVSASMTKVDPPLRRSRIDLVRDAALQGQALLSDASEAGLWLFSTNLTPTTDYLKLLPLQRLDKRIGTTTGRDLGIARLRQLPVEPKGGTGLYDTALAAYQEMTRSYDPTRLNSIVLFTDGRNDDRASISLEQLVDQLRKLHNPKKPIPVYTVGFGADIDIPALKRISDATDGQTYVSTDPAFIKQVFLEALAARSCPATECVNKASVG